MVCSDILLDLSNFMVVSYAIKVPASDLSTEQKRSSTNLRYSLALSVCGMVVLMLFAIVIRINIKLNLLECFHALSLDFSSSVLSILMIGFSSNSDKSRSNTPKWKLTCSLYLEKFKPLNTVTDETCECSEISTRINHKLLKYNLKFR